MNGEPFLEFESPREGDWPAILDLANRSVAQVPGAGTQEQWLQNRRGFPQHGYQYHVVLAAGSDVLGYGAVEQRAEGPADAYRLYLVTEPERLGDHGLQIYEHLEWKLRELGAAGAWFVEYAEDGHLISFLLDLGYRQVRRFRLESGVEAMALTRALPREA